MDLSFVTPALQFIARTINAVRENFTNYYTNNSLTKVDKLLRVEPITVVSKDCTNLLYIPQVMQSCLSIFSAYWLRSLNYLVNVNRVEFVRILDRLQPDRDSTGFLAEEALDPSRECVSLENMKFSLTTPRQVKMKLRPATEAAPRGDNLQALSEMADLSVGKTFNVVIGHKEEIENTPRGNNVRQIEQTVPVSIRLLVSLVPNTAMVTMLSLFKDDVSLVERWHAWRSGSISGIGDLIFCRDIGREYRKALMQDKSGAFSEIARRAANAKAYGLVTKNPSMVVSSNIYVITSEMAAEIGSKLGGTLSNPKIRDKMFESTYAMMVVVIDREAERVTFYIADTAQPSSLSVRDLKANNKGKGDDVSDLLKALVNQQTLF